MKTCLLVPVILALAAALLAGGCDGFERDAYRTLKVAKVEYELLQEHAARAYLSGRLSEEQWNRFAIAGHRFIAAHTLAADLLKTYQEARRAGDAAEGQSRAEAIHQQALAALAELPRLLADLRVLLESFNAAAPAES